MLDSEKQRRHVMKHDISATLPQNLSNLLWLIDEDEVDKTVLCITNHVRFEEVVEKLLHRLSSELSLYQERVENLKVCVSESWSG